MLPTADPILAMLQYDHLCTDQLATVIETLPAGKIMQPFPIGLGTLHASLYHLVVVAEKWTDRSRAVPTGVVAKAYPGPGKVAVAELRRRYAAAGEEMIANWVALSAVPAAERGAEWLIKRNHLLHLTGHAMHHRAQMINMLRQLGEEIPFENGDFGGWANGQVRRK